MNEKKIFEVMKTLSTRDILILYLRSVMDMTYKDIGKRVIMSYEGVRKRYLTILRKIKDDD